MIGPHLDFKRSQDGGWLVWCRDAWRVAESHGDATALGRGYRCQHCRADLTGRIKAAAAA